ncbi:MAG: hypothetical protein ABT10_13815 [Novosphingobium sp. SCN 63-17]|nr:MAG: hypothetical protein ABT10_13815 [Novosphingobium sp. SCN 63-17]
MRGSIVKGFRVGCVLLALMAVAGPVLAQERPPVCAAPVAPTGDLAAWASPGDRAAAADMTGLPAATLAIGEAARVKLLPTPAVRYPLRPEKPGGSVSFGGLVRLHVTTPGTYRVALGSGAWIDLVAGGEAVVSTAHGHGPDCSGIRKMVDFPLETGDYTLQFAANGADAITVLAVKLP